MTVEKKIYSVSQIVGLVKVVLEENLPTRLIVRGEISGWKHHRSSGHCYFSLKDESGALLPCVMWKSSFSKVKFEPEDGMAVLATGHIDVYPQQGRFQFYVDKLEPEGVGALQIAFEQMVKKLKAEGLFDEEHKKELPKFPQRIGILTSESGAAVGDIQTSIWHRWPCVKLLLYPVPVQGEGAAAKIAAAIKDVNRRRKELKLDLLIVGRGGGSLEDLWAFNEEVLARAIFASKIPVISAVGHEQDTTVADLVADARASTPTKAGVVAVPDKEEMLRELAAFERSLVSKLQSQVGFLKQQLATLLASSVFRHPMLAVQNYQQRLDELKNSLVQEIREGLDRRKELLRRAFEQVSKIEPHRLMGEKKVQLTQLEARSQAAVRRIIEIQKRALVAKENRLAGLDPKSVLNRGYSITINRRTGKVVREPDDVTVGDTITTELAKKKIIESKVEKT